METLPNIFKGMSFGTHLVTRSGKDAFFIRQSNYYYLVKVDGVKDDVALYCNGHHNLTGEHPNDIVGLIKESRL